MNYYPHHIGDYLRDTSHLSILEDGTYRRMLDIYYASEKPLPLNLSGIYRLVRAKSRDEKTAVDTVLEEFFFRTEEGWRNKRADAEILLSKEKSEKARASAECRWTSGRNAKAMRTHSERIANASPEQCERNAKAMLPITNNQEPITKNQKRVERSRGSRLPPGWQPSEILKAWAIKERPDLNCDLTVAKFRDHWLAVPGSKGCKLDWEATFRNWVRAEHQGKAAPDYSQVIANLKD